MRILVTGSRDWPSSRRSEIERALVEHYKPGAVIVHGDCPTGADFFADHAALSWGWEVERHPADWTKHRKAAGPLRNQEMVNLGADVCLAFPLGASRGTRDCMARAEAAGIPVIVCPQGRVDG